MKSYTTGAGLKSHQKTLIGVAVVSLILWTVPLFGFIMLPLQYLNAHLHEFSHAFMAILTGGSVGYIKVFAGGSGVTMATGSPVLVNSAGYLGATLIGGLMIWFSRSERGAAITLRVIGAILVFSYIFWVRGDAVGFAAGIVWMALLFVLPSVLKGRQLVFVGQLLGMQQCLASVLSLYVLLKISAFGEPHSDAGNMASLTGIPPLFWALLWSAIGLGSLLFTLRLTWNRQPGS